MKVNKLETIFLSSLLSALAVFLFIVLFILTNL